MGIVCVYVQIPRLAQKTEQHGKQSCFILYTPFQCKRENSIYTSLKITSLSLTGTGHFVVDIAHTVTCCYCCMGMRLYDHTNLLVKREC